MPTQYRISLTAEHPLKMGLSPDGRGVLQGIETLLRVSGVEPIAGTIERIDDDGPEFVGSLHRAPDVLILGMAKLFDGVLAQKSDFDSDKYDTRFVGYDIPYSLVDLAQAIIAERDEQLKEAGHA